MSASSSCAATTTIREALGRLLAQDSWEKPHVDAGLAALASLEQLVEAAQATIAGVERDLSEWLEDDGDGTVDGFAYFIRLRAALAAVGPGQGAT